MNCLKCGREITGQQVFCDGCQDVMHQYPVRADIAVHLPHRSLQPEQPVVSKKRPPTAEELLSQARQENKRLRGWIIILCVIIILGAAAAMLYKFRAPIIENIGRNYTTYIK